MAYYIPYALALLLAVDAALGLTCYKCNSRENIQCAWGGGLTAFFHDSKKCKNSGAKCYTIIKKKGNSEYIQRGCLEPPITIGCNGMVKAIGWSANDSDISCETCYTDRCNSAQKFSVTFIGLSLAAAVFLF